MGYSKDPLFVDVTRNNIALQASSPALGLRVTPTTTLSPAVNPTPFDLTWIEFVVKWIWRYNCK